MARKNQFLGINITRLAGITAGAAAAKFVNPQLRKMVGKYITDDPGTEKNEGQMARIAVAGVKIAGGFYVSNKMRGQFMKDAGLGIVAVGGLELLEEVAPQLQLSGMGYVDTMEVGNVIEVNLDELRGGGSRVTEDLENYQEVAGGVTDDYLEDEMELAGVYADYY